MEEDEAPGSSLGAMLAAAADDSDDSGSQDGDFDPSKVHVILEWVRSQCLTPHNVHAGSRRRS